MGPTLNDPFRMVIGLGYHYNGIAWAIVWDPNKAINIVEWSICGYEWLEGFLYVYYILYSEAPMPCIVILSEHARLTRRELGVENYLWQLRQVGICAERWQHFEAISCNTE